MMVAQQHEIGLQAGCNGADAMLLAQHTRARRRHPAQGLARRDGRSVRNFALSGALAALSSAR